MGFKMVLSSLSILAMRRWAVSALKTREWESISSQIRMDTGLRSYQRKDNRYHDENNIYWPQRCDGGTGEQLSAV